MATKLNEVLDKYNEFASYLDSLDLERLVEGSSFEELKEFHEELRRKELRPVNKLVFIKMLNK